MVEVTSTKRDTHYVKLTCYGQAGVGKTVLCSTAPKPLIISAEAGLLSLASQDVPVIEVANFAELQAAYAYVKDKGVEFETICLDSISDVAEQVLDQAMDDLRRTSLAEGKNMDPRQGYGKMAIEMMKLTRAFRNLNKHIVFTAKMGHVQDDIAKVTRFGPMLPGQMYTQNFPYLMDILCCMRVAKDSTRYLQTQPDLQYLCKDRSGKLDQVEEPDLLNIFTKVTNT